MSAHNTQRRRVISQPQVTTPVLNLQHCNDGRLFDYTLKTYIKRLAYDAENRVGYLDCGLNDMVYFRRDDSTWGHKEQRLTLNGQ